MRLIVLTNGKHVKVDDWNYNRLARFNWYENEYGYAYRYTRASGKLAAVLMHRDIAGAEGDVEVDHRDRDPLNNQEYNLRVATKGQNRQNKSVYANNTSGFKGVTWHKGKWRVRVGKVEAGRFDCKVQAAIAYNAKAVELYGEFASLNEIP